MAAEVAMVAARTTVHFSGPHWNINSTAWNGIAWKGRRTDMIYDSRFMVCRVVLLGLLSIAGLQAETLLLTGATVHTVSGATITNGQVLVRDGRIAAVGSVVTAGDAKQVSLVGLHLYPGLI